MIEAGAALAATMESIARGAGVILMRHYEKLEKRDIGFKGPRDLLTIADRESEAHVVLALQQAFPDHAIWAEEGGGDARAKDSYAAGRPVWFIDPLDGTTNYAHGHPIFAVALGLWQSGRPVAGCIYAPRLDEMFVGVEGFGATLNGRPIRVSSAPTIKDALLATGFAYRLDEAPDDNTENFRRIVRQARGVRRCGSAGLDLAFVAAGRYDGFWELDLAPWDVAAGGALIRCAGGRVGDFRGGEEWLFGGNIIASNGLVHDEIAVNLNPR